MGGFPMIRYLLAFSILYTPVTTVQEWYDTLDACERAAHIERRIARQELGYVPAYQCKRVVR